MRKTQGEYQHESLITPVSWTDAGEQRFAIRLRQIIDDLYRKAGRTAKRLEELEKRADHGQI